MQLISIYLDCIFENQGVKLLNAGNWIIKEQIESPCLIISDIPASNREEDTEAYGACDIPKMELIKPHLRLLNLD